jgi:hypothetical protein
LSLIEGESASENFPVTERREKLKKLNKGHIIQKLLPQAVAEPDCQNLRPGIALEKLPVELGIHLALGTRSG